MAELIIARAETLLLLLIASYVNAVLDATILDFISSKRVACGNVLW